MRTRVLTRWFWRRPEGRLAVGLRVVEAHAGHDLAVDHFRRHRAQLAGVLLRAVADLRRHAQAQIVGVAFRHRQFHFQLAQVHDHQQRRVGRHHRAVGDRHRADHAVDRRADVEFVDLALQFGHDRALTLRQQMLVARVQAGAAVLQAVLALGMRQADVGLLQRILRARDVDLGNGAAVEAALLAFQVADGGGAVDLGLVEQPARRGARELGIEGRPAGLGFQARQCRLLLHQAAAQLGAVDLGQRLALLDLVASPHLQLHGAGSGRVQGRADRGDHPSLNRDIAHQRAATDLGDADALGTDRLAGAQPAAEGGDGEGQQQRCADAAADQQLLAARADGGRGDDAVLSGGVADHSIEVFAGESST